MIAAIEAQLCTLPVPDRWRSFRSTEPHAEEEADALACVVAAAVHLGTVYDGMTTSALLGAVTPQSKRRGISRRRHVPGALSPQDLEALAIAGGMHLSSPPQQSVQQFLQQGQLWIALVRQRFVNPLARSCTFRRGGAARTLVRRSVVKNHYLLVLDYLHGPEALVVFDPHPWNRSVYCVGVEMFERAWRAARRLQFPWSGLLSPQLQLQHAFGY
jgi:hypothetical protein